MTTRTAKVAFELIALRSTNQNQSSRWQLGRLLDEDPSEFATIESVTLTLAGQSDPSLSELAGVLGAGEPEDFIEALADIEAAESASDDEAAAWQADTEQFERAWEAFASRTPAAERTWGNFRISIVQQQRGDDLASGVRLLTVHKAQGREFKAVAVVGLNDGQLPDFRATSDDEMKSELRTFYVAVTRPTRLLLLTRSAMRRTRYGSRGTTESRFLSHV